jgi:hypothetical protein
MSHKGGKTGRIGINLIKLYKIESWKEKSETFLAAKTVLEQTSE